jgi:transcriptional regulator with XRE-family HTH domain
MARFELKWKASDLIDALEPLLGRRISPQTLSQWEHGKKRRWSQQLLEILAQALRKPPSYFTAPLPHLLPLILTVEKTVDAAIAGAVRAKRYAGTCFKLDGGFAMAAPDDGMEPSIKRGDILFFARHLDPEQDDIVLARVGDALLLRRLSFVGKRIILAPTTKEAPVVSLTQIEWYNSYLLGILCPVDAWLRRLGQNS